MSRRKPTGEEIIRVKDVYYEVLRKPFRDHFRLEMAERRKVELKEDGWDMRDIPKYKDFYLEPNYLNYRKTYKSKFYNVFAPFDHDFIQGEWPTIELLLKHIFGEQYYFSLDYFWNLLIHPTQKLPIVALVSKERKTGKTTFLDFVRDMFGVNYVKVDPEAMSSSFNSSWASKNIVAIDETVIEKTQIIERLKDISTSGDILVNGKYQAPYTVPIYIKVIMNSNSEDRFIRVDEEEVRFWIRKIPIIQDEMVDIQAKLLKEIPAFAYYLRHEHKPSYGGEPQSRHWFRNEDIETEWLRAIKDESKTWLAKELKMRFEDWFYQNPDSDKCSFTCMDIKEVWYQHNTKVTVPFISRTLRDDLKIENKGNIRHKPDLQKGESLTLRQGRAYVINREDYTEKIEEDEPENIPF